MSASADRPPFLDLPPLVALGGTVRLPGSKSISNRVLLLAGLAEGTTLVHDLLASDDTAVMLDALRTLGCTVTPSATPGGPLAVTGLGGRLAVKEADLFLGNAGTAMRPLAAALALLAARQGTTGAGFRLRGIPRMHERPIGDLVEALRPLGCQVACTGTEGYPPLALSGPGALALDASIRVRGDVSSQFLTALLLALPLVAEDRALQVEVQGELISKPYVEITLKLLARFGIAVEREGWQRFTLPAGSRYRSPGAVHVEGDASSASYFIGAAAIAAVDAPLRIEGVGADSIQGDIRFVDAARAMGADVTMEANALLVKRGAWPLKAVDLDCNAIPDAAMTLAVMALYAQGTTRLSNIASWRVKETDRLAAMRAELTKFGATVIEGPDFLEVTPPAGAWQRAALHTYDDHRMAMCASLAAFNPLAPGAAGQPAVAVRVLDPGCVAKTYPDYFADFLALVTPQAGAVPVITIDGPTASGKGTLASRVAQRLGYHHLDSGALYRACALAAQRAGIAPDDEPALAALAAALPLRFEGGRAWLGTPGEDVTDRLREEAIGQMASQIAALPALRAALLDWQRRCRRAPGLVTDGRDMGTVIFPDAQLKVFLTASAAQRAERRHRQLAAAGVSATLPALLADLEARDARDRSRSSAPLKAAEDARQLDNSALSIEASVEQLLRWWDDAQGGAPHGPEHAPAA
ncbi:bifunctional 3-phosphoshikimate 1-carboxyvinyltransferase/cytidylate kinase [Aquariibacter albus]|uniref:Multifunctional fusion protein n=1 Tax=Aquariibacter albus TaxID=2759899 RepID=A0A839HFJ6_9BURK|nr:bifunctional 3-phosphoshikimate 1-carboxyvinyltransferase/cytidylate kinase [Aquariibacter albus]MBB1160625.1 bifunctional 3-phosphoshikimate 1-carboxyvinyltransferase/cytidylate kinase [Aquariibacter albus]